MQTFLPYSSFEKSADILDKRRCWKQVVEAYQIINCLKGINSLRWVNHPAVKMWKGHLNELMYYYNCFLDVCLEKHKINTKMKHYYIGAMYNNEIISVKLDKTLNIYKYPWWLGNEDFHRSVRAKLIEKNSDYYLNLFNEDKGFNENKYMWPDMENKTFKILV